MHILVTGINGLLGRAVQKLLSSKHKITALVRDEVIDACSDVEYIRCNLLEKSFLQRLPNKIDAILHLAQSPFYREFPDKADDVLTINTIVTQQLLQYAVHAEAKQFLLASTGSIYEPYDYEMVESAAVNPQSFYATTKYMAERLLVPYQSYLKVCALRLFFLYGHHPLAKPSLINTLIQRVKQGQNITISGPGSGMEFSPTCIDDVADIFSNAIESKWDGITNIANPQQIGIKEAALLMGKCLGKEVFFEYQYESKAPIIVPNLSKQSLLLPNYNFTSLECGLSTLIDKMN